MTKEELTKEELSILNNLVEVFNKFKGLENHHPSDIQDFVDALHIQQRIIMTRLTRRLYSGIFT